jgi:hypothetical protein
MIKSSKSQNPNPREFVNTNIQMLRRALRLIFVRISVTHELHHYAALVLGDWGLKFVWNLALGIWCFRRDPEGSSSFLTPRIKEPSIPIIIMPGAAAA